MEKSGAASTHRVQHLLQRDQRRRRHVVAQHGVLERRFDGGIGHRHADGGRGMDRRFQRLAVTGPGVDLTQGGPHRADPGDLRRQKVGRLGGRRRRDCRARTGPRRPRLRAPARAREPSPDASCSSPRAQAADGPSGTAPGAGLVAEVTLGPGRQADARCGRRGFVAPPRERRGDLHLRFATEHARPEARAVVGRIGELGRLGGRRQYRRPRRPGRTQAAPIRPPPTTGRGPRPPPRSSGRPRHPPARRMAGTAGTGQMPAGSSPCKCWGARYIVGASA